MSALVAKVFHYFRRYLNPVISGGWIACYTAVIASAANVPANVPLSQTAKKKIELARSPLPFCDGAYASDFVVLSPDEKKNEEETKYSFCVRSTSIYQCPYYNPDGTLQTKRETRIAHGTAFAFRKEGNSAYLATNEHVTDWPLVTTKDTPVEDIPLGCRRTSQTVVIVDDENDAYARDDIPTQRVAVDAELDVSILKAPIKVEKIPFALGQSASLKNGDIVRVRGFPLGEFQAVHLGSVVNPREYDEQGRWNHYDFVIDASLSSGQSGSPILAVSCRTRRLELVGIYHAGFVRGQGMNVAVGIDEFREMLVTLKVRAKNSFVEHISSQDRAFLLEDLHDRTTLPFFSYGGLTVGARVLDKKIYFEIFSKRYPTNEWRHLIIEDLPSDGFGRIGRLWFGSELGLKEKVFADLEPAEQAQLSKLLDGLRHQIRRTLQLRLLEKQARKSRISYERLRVLQRQMERASFTNQTRIRAMTELAAKYAPGVEEGGVSLQTIFFSTTPRPSVNGLPVEKTVKSTTNIDEHNVADKKRMKNIADDQQANQ